ncbi:MAG: polysaccharide biosynthesis protein [Ruminococcaceae bacterium]|nr:polysaccharide biosynthesis protein [Oscillospiraceae bacterium]
MSLKITKIPLILKKIAFLTADALSVVISIFLSIYVYNDFSLGTLSAADFNNLILTVLFLIPITMLMCYFSRLYNSVWTFAGIFELFGAVIASVFSTIGFVVLSQLIIMLNSAHHKSVIYVASYILYFFFFTVLLVFSRFSYRFLRVFSNKKANMDLKDSINVMLIGAGAAGLSILRDISNSGENSFKICCIIDDNEAKWGKYLYGSKIVGGRNSIKEYAEKFKIDEIFIAIPSASPEEISKIVDICHNTKCKLKTLPGIHQLLDGTVSVQKMREVSIEDLLGRTPVKANLESIMSYVSGKVVMVTGGGGSIGSELCRQIANYSPKKLIIVDIYENNAYDIQQELITTYPTLDFEVLIASVRNTERMRSIFKKYRPQIVYHAAAHKHVPLMEHSPNEAVKNNVFGTLRTVRAADEFGTERFVLISTDKAVNPTNVMGATKRICEMIIQTYNNRSKTEFVAVRFGNVLGSNGSVIPLFKKQIAQGGPVKVTHPDIIRYFMTIPEAVSLVLQAGANAKGGEIFVLDMGKPVKILDLATNLIRLSGYTPGKDIKIEFTGLRPGEKLYEELLMNEEGLKSTENELIHIGKPIEFDEKIFLDKLEMLYSAAYDETDDIKPLIRSIVDTYHDPDEINKKVAASAE